MAKIHFLNVGHGDCTIIEHGNGNLTMIDINNGEELDDDSSDALLKEYSRNADDYLEKWVSWKTGEASSRMLLAETGYDIKLTNPIEFLKNNYPGRSIFRYIQTHPDFDHMRGLAALEDSGIKVVNFWDMAHSRRWDDEKDQESDKVDWEAYQRFRSGRNARVLNLHRGSEGKFYNQNDEGQLGGNGLHILSPTPKLVSDFDEDGKRNELSYVLQYKFKGNKFFRKIIFGGDAEQSAWDSIYGHYGANLKCDVLKASHHGRDSGYHQEPANPVLRERWHKQLSALLGKTLPTAEEESKDPAQADEVYEAATRLLIGETRDVKLYPFVYRDNVNYGFCRNLYALRHLGIAAALLGLVASIGAGYWSLKMGKLDYLPLGCAAVCGGLLLWWIFIVTSKWVKVPAMNYAQHLFEASEKLSRAKK